MARWPKACAIWVLPTPTGTYRTIDSPGCSQRRAATWRIWAAGRFGPGRRGRRSGHALSGVAKSVGVEGGGIAVGVVAGSGSGQRGEVGARGGGGEQVRGGAGGPGARRGRVALGAGGEDALDAAIRRV